MRRLAALLIACSCMTSAHAVELAPTFRDGCVLQHGVVLPVWGYAAAGATVTVQLGTGSTSVTADAAGSWRAVLPARAPGATGLTLSASATGETSATVADVAIGEVWILGGQSNMQWTFENTRNRKGELGVAPPEALTRVRLFMVTDVVSGTPARLLPTSADWPVPTGFAAASWRAASIENLLPSSMTGYHFARLRTQEVPWPIGLISVARGGTHIETWMDGAGIATAFGDPIPSPPPVTRTPTAPVGSSNKAPTQRYNGTIFPIAGHAAAGVLWYQGEDNGRNGDSAVIYDRLLAGMRAQWRAIWGQADLPFVVVQLHANSSYGNYWPEVRDGQRRAVLTDPRSRLLPTADILGGLHPGDRAPLGPRLAAAARSLIEGTGPGDAPIPRRAVRQPGSGSVTIHCDDPAPLVFGAPALTGAEPVFQLLADGIWHPATASISGGVVSVSASGIAAPTALRYGWHEEPLLTLLAADGLPVSPCELAVESTASLQRTVSVDVPGRSGLFANTHGASLPLPAVFSGLPTEQSLTIALLTGGDG